MNIKFFCLLILLLLNYTFPINAMAGLLRVESETFTSARQNDKRIFELPFYENLSASFITEKKDFEFNSDFSVFTDPVTQVSHNQADVHLLDIKFQAIPDFMQVRMGRTFDTQGSFGASSVDLVATDFYFMNKQLLLGTFIGAEHKIDDQSAYTNLWGANVSYLSNDFLPYFLSTKFIQRLNNQSVHSTENLMQLAGKKSFDGAWSPELVLVSQTNITKSNTDKVEAGLDLYPSIYSYARVRTLTYDVLPDTGNQQPIYSIFSQGRLYETRLQYQYKFNPRYIGAVSLIYDNYQLQVDKRTSGYGSEVEVDYLGDWAHVINTFYTFASYGGKVYGNRILLKTERGLKHEFYALADVTYYEKITSSKRNAINTQLGWSQSLNNNLKLNIGGELNSNNISLYDLRAFAKLTYFLWSET